MAARKTKKTHYVRTKKRKGADSAVIAQRSVVIVMGVLILVAMVMGIGLGFRWIGHKLLSENPRFTIQHLDISCTGKISEENVREWTGLREGTNLFAFSFSEIRETLENVPVVESAELQRELPGTLYIRVKERVPVARIVLKRYSNPCPLDRYAYVLSPRSNPALAQLPLIKGLDADMKAGDQIADEDVECALEIIALCEGNRKLHSFVLLESLDVKYDDYIDMRLSGGIRVRMPRYRLQPKLQQLATIIQMAQEQGKRVKEVDLTLDSPKVPTTYY